MLQHIGLYVGSVGEKGGEEGGSVGEKGEGGRTSPSADVGANS